MLKVGIRIRFIVRLKGLDILFRVRVMVKVKVRVRVRVRVMIKD